LKNGDVITATYASVDATSVVSTYVITPTLVDPGAKLGNYSVTTNTGTLTVTAAPLNVTANDASRVYGSGNPPFAGAIIGLKNGDAITASFFSLTNLTTPVGTYANGIQSVISDPTAKLGNYAVTKTN